MSAKQGRTGSESPERDGDLAEKPEKQGVEEIYESHNSTGAGESISVTSSCCHADVPGQGLNSESGSISTHLRKGKESEPTVLPATRRKREGSRRKVEQR